MQEVEILQSVKFFSIDSLYNRSISSATRARMNGIVFSSVLQQTKKKLSTKKILFRNFTVNSP